MSSGIPPVGAFAVDTRDGRVGQVMAVDGPFVQLRPPGGGIEWDVPPQAVRAAQAGEELSARVRGLNWQSRLP